MIEVHNKIAVQNTEHAQHLEEAFSQTNHRMAQVPGFCEFNLLKSRDGSHYIVRVVWESEEAFQAWASSDHFRRAHQGQTADGSSADVSQYQVVI